MFLNFLRVFEIFGGYILPNSNATKCIKMGVVENYWSYFQGQYLEIYINMYPNIWARVDSLEICSKFFLISVCILQINLCKPPQPYHLTGGLTRLPVAQLNNSWVSSGDSETWLASMYQAGLPGSSSWARISWKRCWITVEGLGTLSWNSRTFVGIHGLSLQVPNFEEDTYLVCSGSLVLQDISFVQSLDDQMTRFQYFLIVDLFHHHLGKLIVMPNHLSNSLQGKATRNDTYLIQRQTMFIHT